MTSVVGIALALVSTHVKAQGTVFVLGPMNEVGRRYDFTRVPQAAFGPDNRLAVLQPQDFSVLLFDLSKADRPTAVAGRRGDGPGEFSRPGDMGWIDNTLWVADGGRPRVELFSAAGKVISSTLYDAPRSSARYFRYFGLTAFTRDSAVVYFPSVIGTPRDPVVMTEDPPLPVLLYRNRAATPDTIAQPKLRGGLLVLRGDRDGGTVSGIATQPYSRRTFFRAGADGRGLLLVLQAEPDVQDGRTLVKVISPTGTVIFQRVLDRQPRVLSNAEWDSVTTSLAREYAKDTWSTEAKARAGLREALIRPKFHPVVSDAVLGRDATVWLRLEQETRGMATWIILSPIGKDLGTIAIPREVRLTDATATRVVGVRTDSDGIDQVIWMSVRPRASP